MAVAAIAVVAALATAWKHPAGWREKFDFQHIRNSDSEVMATGAVEASDVPGSAPSNDIQAVAARIQAAASPVNERVAGSEPATDQPVIVGQAEQQPSAQSPAAPQTASPGQAGGPEQPVVDESALRYFASRGDTVRLQAEISRLRALYPNWVPPTDPLAVPPNRDRQLEAMWQLYSEGRYAELRKAIADRQMSEAGWQPPADLLDRLDVAESRARLVNASDLKQYATVVDIAAVTPSLLTCSEVDVLWRVAEAFVKTDKPQRGQDVYTYILTNCTNPAERLATIQKASDLLSYQLMQALLGLEKPGMDGGREFDSIRDDLARRFVGEGNADAGLVVAPDYLSRVERLAQTQGLASDALLLGWYQLRRRNDMDAEKWFRAARAREDSASASQGLALVLIGRKAPQEAEDVMYRWRDVSDDAAATYLAATANLMALQPPASLSEDVLRRIAAVVIERKNVTTAQQFGWYARSLNQLQTAVRWFETALRWKPDDEPSAYGLVLTRAQLNDRKRVSEIQRLWAGRSQRIADLGEASPSRMPARGLPAPDSRPVAAGHQPGSSQALPAASGAPSFRARPSTTVPARRNPRQTGGCSTTIDPARLGPGDALARGWCLMDINRPMEAVSAFEVALKSPTQRIREDAAYGQSLAYLRVGLVANAAVAATKAPQSQERAVELQVAILADRALSAFDAGRYRETLVYLDQRAQLQQERIDLVVLRGYCYLNLKMYGDARRIFEAAAATGNRDAARGLADLRKATNPDING